jgi:murein DD-endopeptidase MepM/ murein hydrolase activator NlpD
VLFFFAQARLLCLIANAVVCCIMKSLLLYSTLLFFCSCSLLQNGSFVAHISKTLPDTAYAYALPYAKGTTHRLWQGYHSVFSHHGNMAVDFKMKRGTPVHAARGGVIVVVVEENKNGGLGRRFINKENSISIRHSDSTFAHYLHLQYKSAAVAVGDTVKEGRVIGLSGHTGFSAFPHLHFELTKGLQKGKNEVPFRFKTEQGVLFLQPLRRYKAL